SFVDSGWLVCLISTAALMVGPAVATADDPPAGIEDPSLQTMAAQWYAQHYDVSLSTAYERLQVQDDANVVLRRVAAAVGSRYGGAWYDANDGGRLKIAVAGLQSATEAVADARGLLEDAGVSDDADFVDAEHSLADLSATQSDLDQNLAELS